MKSYTTSFARHTLWALAALLATPAWTLAGQTGEPPAFDLRVPLEALSSALREAQEHLQAQNREGQSGQRDPQREGRTGRDAQWDAVYERARQAIERAQWTQALQQFTMLAQANAPRSDAAMYWRAYAFDKMNRHTDALAAVGNCSRTSPRAGGCPTAGRSSCSCGSVRASR
jgi:hypothetical protein